MGRDRGTRAILGTALLVLSSVWALGGCAGCEGMTRGIYEATQERQRAEKDPPRDLAATYDEYERFRRTPAAPDPAAPEPGR